MAENKQITASEVIKLLGQGYYRYKSPITEGRSIQEYYGLSVKNTKELFENEALKDIRRSFTRKTNTFTFVDDITEDNKEENIVIVDDEPDTNEVDDNENTNEVPQSVELTNKQFI